VTQVRENVFFTEKRKDMFRKDPCRRRGKAQGGGKTDRTPDFRMDTLNKGKSGIEERAAGFSEAKERRGNGQEKEATDGRAFTLTHPRKRDWPLSNS